MLVLSRKADQSVHFPNLGIKIEVLSINGKTVKVGIDAPREVAILRGELAKLESAQLTNEAIGSQPSREERHELRNQLHAAKMALHVLQKQLAAGLTEQADKTLERALTALGNLDDIAAPVAIGKEFGQDGQCRALVVEDNPNERELMKGFLELCGYQVDAVEDGEAALEFLASHSRPDIVLLDVNMPRMDGPTTVSAIRSNPDYNDVKLFMVSGEDRGDVHVTEGMMGIQQWFSKPIEPAAFASGIAKTVSANL